MNNTVYLALASCAVPIDEYLRLNVLSHKGTSYGEIEKRHGQELKAGCDLVKVSSIEEIRIYE